MMPTSAMVEAQPPSFTFFLMDDTGFNDIGYQSTNRSVPIRTPRIDALAAGGVRLTDYYVQPICTPTRAALMTGRYPFRYGVTGYTISARAPWGIPANETFLPEFFKDAGYTTACFGKCASPEPRVWTRRCTPQMHDHHDQLSFWRLFQGTLASSSAHTFLRRAASIASRACTMHRVTTTSTPSTAATTGTWTSRRDPPSAVATAATSCATTRSHSSRATPSPHPSSYTWPSKK